MGKKKHPFIDKKTAHKFNVVHRSQRDPLQADAESSQHVLVPAGTAGMSDGAGATDDRTEDKTKYGIYYDDEYDYLQHLRPRGEGMLIMAEDIAPKPKPKPKDDCFGVLNLPDEVLPSKYEESIGMLNKGVLPRGPQPDWDPDIVACLDDEIDMDDEDNFLQDDFIKMANAENMEDFCGEGGDYDDGYNYAGTVLQEGRYIPGDMPDLEGMDDPGLNSLYTNVGKAEKGENDSDADSTQNFYSDQELSDFEDDNSEEETKSRFTNYSMTSSVIRRTKGLKILDDRFERLMEEYDEEEIGPVDHEEMTGTFSIHHDLMDNIMEEFIQDHTKIPISEAVDVEEETDIRDAEKSDGEENVDDDDKLFEGFEKREKPDWDCESIISTYSNIYNHPKIIDEPKLIKLDKSGIPMGVLKDKQTEKQRQQNEEDDTREEEQHISLSNIRKKNETAEEKKARKQEVKMFRKERRAEKKDNKMFFKDEHRKQEKISMNRSNLIAIP